MATSTERVRRFRERQRAALVPIEGPCPLPLDEQLAPSVAETLGALPLEASDQAAAALALQLARVIDRAANQPFALRHLGPLLLTNLESMGATPASRPAPKPAPPGPTQLDRLRERRSGRGPL